MDERNIRTRQTLTPLNLLPSLANNLKRGNSLIDDPSVAEDTAFDWQKEFSVMTKYGGFDVVVGNPPYERIQTMAEYAPESLEFLKANYKTAESGNFDIYVCFVEKGLSLLREHGLFGYILPHKFFQADYGKALRQLLSQGEHLHEIVSFGHQQIFTHVSTYTCLLLLSKARSAKFIYREAFDIGEWKLNGRARSSIFPSSTATFAQWTFLASEVEEKLLTKLRAVPERLETVTDRIFQGLKTSADEIYIVDELERRANKVRIYSHETESEHWFEPDLVHPLVKSGDSRRYALADPRRLILFPYAANEKAAMELISAETLGKKYPLIWEYLLANRARLEQREDGKMIGDQWYAFGRNQALDVIAQPKIFTPDLAIRAAYSLDETGAKFFTGGVAGGYGIIVKPKIDRIYVLALLNSRLLDWFVAKTGTTMRGGWHSYEARFIRGAPIILPKNSKPYLSELGRIMMKLSRQRQRFLSLLPEALVKEHRTTCSLGHYLQKDYASAVTADVLIDDVMLKGFLHKIDIESDNATLLLSAHVSATAKGEPEIVPIFRMRFDHAPLRQFIYACWQQFLSENARRKRLTTADSRKKFIDGSSTQKRRWFFFMPARADNLRAITSLLESVAGEVGVSDLAALEAEIKSTDEKIDKLVYELYGLTPEEIKTVESAFTKKASA